jgi:hypothetical protein
MFAAEKNVAAVESGPKEVPAEVKTMLADEIKAMDQVLISFFRKKELRKEVRN